MRIACVFVPQLALQAVLRRTPEARGGPVAVLEAAAPAPAAVPERRGGAQQGAREARRARDEFSPEARREGVRAGHDGRAGRARSAPGCAC